MSCVLTPACLGQMAPFGQCFVTLCWLYRINWVRSSSFVILFAASELPPRWSLVSCSRGSIDCSSDESPAMEPM